MAINMFCGEVKTFLEAVKMGGNALEEVTKMGSYYYYFFFFAKRMLL